jgi:anti-sigma regulatory factor (Ser/Thr protein kinase)
MVTVRLFSKPAPSAKLDPMAAPIRLTVPGTLRYRSIAVRVVAEAARLVSCSAQRDPEDPFSNDVRHPFDTAVVSAFMEIFNNIAIHAYKRKGGGAIEISITPSERDLVIEVRDQGHPFDLDEVAPLPSDLDVDSLPEGGMGIHIAKTMLDEMTYEPGPPNLWRLCKRLTAGSVASGRS